ncbi:MAG TPA: hypothetical protein DEW46_05940 [Verrucomicrobia bacterium]|nr:hypothetical protein [Verrucomicrobiota bacterium]
MRAGCPRSQVITDRNSRGFLPHYDHPGMVLSIRGDPVFISWSDDPELSAIPDQLPLDGQHVTPTKPGSAGILPAVKDLKALGARASCPLAGEMHT